MTKFVVKFELTVDAHDARTAAEEARKHIKCWDPVFTVVYPGGEAERIRLDFLRDNNNRD